MTNCIGCKWAKLKDNPSERKRLGISSADVKSACDACVESFGESCRKREIVCISCQWKDRNLPFEARTLHCRKCVEEFIKKDHQCSSCPWNDPKRPMPTDAALMHCKACLAKEESKAMNCTTCPWRNTPKAVRAKHCASCSLKFAGNSKVVNSTNELSNKGQTIESYDNHNAAMTDDRDSVMKLRRDYLDSRKSSSRPGMAHPVYEVAERCGKSIEEIAKTAFDMSRQFLYELAGLSDLQALLLLSTVRGEKKTDFAKMHNITDSAVNTLFKQLVAQNETFKSFLILSRGSVRDRRGRKSSGKQTVVSVKKCANARNCGVMQLSLAL